MRGAGDGGGGGACQSSQQPEHAQWNGPASSSAHERIPWRSPHVLSWAPEQVVWHAGELASTAIMDGRVKMKMDKLTERPEQF